MSIGIVAGPVSGVTLPDGRRAGLEFLDVDDADVHARLMALLAVRGARFLLEGLPCEETPRGTPLWLLLHRMSREHDPGQAPVGTTSDGRRQVATLIESRGQGGQCVVALTPPGSHPDHPARGYTLAQGD
jgi:hypothetical protein